MKWIKCSEKLPDTCVQVILLIFDRDSKAPKKLMGYIGHNGEWIIRQDVFSDLDFNPKIWIPIAWHKLPEIDSETKEMVNKFREGEVNE